MNSDILTAALMACAGLGLGVATRLGIWHGFERIYRNTAYPAALRNVGFALIPLGLAFASATAALVSHAASQRRELTMFLVALFPVWLLIAFVVANRPPEVFKPRWLREQEATAPMQIRRDWFDGVVLVGTVGVAAMTLFVMAALWLGGR